MLNSRHHLALTAVLLALATTGVTPIAQAQEDALQPGDVVHDYLVAAVVPPPGYGIHPRVLTAGGTVQRLSVVTQPDGTVEVQDQGDDSTGDSAPREATGLPGVFYWDLVEEVQACQDASYKLDTYKERNTFAWYYNDTYAPSNLGGNAQPLIEAANNIVMAQNNCDMPDQVSAAASFSGFTTRAANISVSGSEIICGTDDGYSVVSWGTLVGSAIAVACPWTDVAYSPDELLHSDIKLDKTRYKWTFNPQLGCLHEYDVQSVMTHEFGHVFGLDHVEGEEHESLTMSETLYLCSVSHRTLGKGDVLGLQARY